MSPSKELLDTLKTACKSCGKKIIFAKTADGQRIPLDPTPPIYDVAVGHEAWATRNTGAMVSHFATCKNPAPFSGKNKGGANGNAAIESTCN